MAKRKRDNGTVAERVKRSKKMARAMQLGFLRTGGFYGRFAGTKAELKFHDVTANVTGISTVGNIAADSLNEIAQGTTESQRIGRKCTIRNMSMRFRFDLNPESAAVDNATVCRVIVYIDKQCNGATAAVTDILETANVYAYRNLANSGRFRTLMDRFYVLNAQNGTATSTGKYSVFGQMFWSLNLPIEYSSTTGAISEIRSNNIGVMVIYDQNTVDADFESYFRLRFSDS